MFYYQFFIWIANFSLACDKIGIEVTFHFPDFRKMVDIGCGKQMPYSLKYPCFSTIKKQKGELYRHLRSQGKKYKSKSKVKVNEVKYPTEKIFHYLHQS